MLGWTRTLESHASRLRKKLRVNGEDRYVVNVDLEDLWRFGVVEHPAPNVEPGDVVMLADGRKALVTATLKAAEATGLMALLQVVVAPLAGEETPE